MTHLDCTSSPGTTLALSLLLTRVYMTHHQLKNDKDKVDSPLPYQQTLPVLVGLTLPFRTTASAVLALLSHPIQPGFIQILKWFSISSAGFTQNLLCSMLPHSNYYFLSIILIANSKQIKRRGQVFLCPMMLCLASSLWDGRFSGNIKQEAQRSQCPSSPGVNNPTRSALKPLLLSNVFFSQSINIPTSVQWNWTPNPALLWIHTLPGNRIRHSQWCQEILKNWSSEVGQNSLQS